MVQRERLHGVSEFIAVTACGAATGDRHAGLQQWQAAVTALETLLLSEVDRAPENRAAEVVVLSGPSPILTHPELLARVPAGSFYPASQQGCLPTTTAAATMAPSLGAFPLPPEDPLVREVFCLVLAARFSLAMAIDPAGQFWFSFAPTVTQRVWQTLSGRLPTGARARLATFANGGIYSWPEPPYQIVTQFSQTLLRTLPANPQGTASSLMDAELLQALTHEVRTPLTAIRLWTRLLLKRKDLPLPALHHLQGIESECTAQIERMELLFRAAEFAIRQAKPANVALQPIALAELLPHKIPHWQHLTQRRQVKLDVVLPQSLPVIRSDAALLDRTLTGLLENYAAGVPAGGHIHLEIAIVGDRLKLQLSQPQTESPCRHATPLKAIGRLLALHPDTGSLTLNLDATKNLFRALGAKLIVRQHATRGSVLAVFLPLEIYCQPC